ncbi:MAG TPA: hypothetical protein VFY84_19355 [Jiangellales bacterium]|nr:hypothetical protein [Jiangellales bacterium]
MPESRQHNEFGSAHIGAVSFGDHSPVTTGDVRIGATTDEVSRLIERIGVLRDRLVDPDGLEILAHQVAQELRRSPRDTGRTRQLLAQIAQGASGVAAITTSVQTIQQMLG